MYSRLPKNFFVQEAEEELDMEEVMRSIKQMRTDFQGYLQESGVQDKLDHINELILQPPELFVERHLKALGLESELMFEKVLSQSPSPHSSLAQTKSKAAGKVFSGRVSAGSRLEEILMQDQPDMFNMSDHVRSGQSRATSAKVQFCDNVGARHLQQAADERGNVIEIQERLNSQDYEVVGEGIHGAIVSCKEFTLPYSQVRLRPRLAL